MAPRGRLPLGTTAMGGFELMLAMRHLRSGSGQTLLTISAVATGVVVVIFISSLVFGVRASISDLLTDMLPAVTVKPLEPSPVPLAKTGSTDFGVSSTRIELHNPQTKNIDDWQTLAVQIENVPGVVRAAPVVTGQAIVSRGGKRIGVNLTGADPDRLNMVQRLTKYVISGHYLGLAADEAIINYKLSQDLNVGLGDRVLITSSTVRSQSFRIAGILDTGEDPGGVAYLCLRPAQSLLETGTRVSQIYVKCSDLYEADAVADRIGAILPYKVESWSRLYPQFVSTLGAYDATAYLISAFSLVATGFAIASVLIVSVLQKSKQIGILKSIGARSRQIQTIFLYEGLGIAIAGSIAGSLLGCGIVTLLSSFKQPPSHPGGRTESLFPSHLTWELIAAAMLAAIASTIVAAILPARRAASVNPVEVMR